MKTGNGYSSPTFIRKQFLLTSMNLRLMSTTRHWESRTSIRLRYWTRRTDSNLLPLTHPSTKKRRGRKRVNGFWLLQISTSMKSCRMSRTNNGESGSEVKIRGSLTHCNFQVPTKHGKPLKK